MSHEVRVRKSSHLRPHTGCHKDDDESSDLNMFFEFFGRNPLPLPTPMKPLYAKILKILEFQVITEMRPSTGVFDESLLLVCQPTCRLFGKGQMWLSLFRYNANVAVMLNLCNAVSNFYNLLLFVPVSEDQPHISICITLHITF